MQCGKDAIPEQKMAISVSETIKPPIQNISYVEIVECPIPVNRPKGSNYVVSAHSVGGSTLFNVKYEEVWVNVLHNNIPMNYITVLSVGHEFNKYPIHQLIY